MTGDQFFCMGAKAPNVEVLNDAAHVCNLPDAAMHPIGTHIQCTAPVVGSAWRDGRCGRMYTRSQTWWRHAPYWSDYDYGW